MAFRIMNKIIRVINVDTDNVNNLANFIESALTLMNCDYRKEEINGGKDIQFRIPVFTTYINALFIPSKYKEHPIILKSYTFDYTDCKLVGGNSNGINVSNDKDILDWLDNNELIELENKFNYLNLFDIENYLDLYYDECCITEYNDVNMCMCDSILFEHKRVKDIKIALEVFEDLEQIYKSKHFKFDVLDNGTKLFYFIEFEDDIYGIPDSVEDLKKACLNKVYLPMLLATNSIIKLDDNIVDLIGCVYYYKKSIIDELEQYNKR